MVEFVAGGALWGVMVVGVWYTHTHTHTDHFTDSQQTYRLIERPNSSCCRELRGRKLPGWQSGNTCQFYNKP